MERALSNDPGPRSPQPVTLVGTAELLVQAVQAFKSASYLSIGLAFFGVFLPQVSSTWALGPAAGKASVGIWSLALGVEQSSFVDPSALPAIMTQVTDFFSVFVVINLLAWIAFLIGYQAMVYQSLHYFRPWAFPRLTTRELLGDMIRLTLKRGILLSALVASLGFATQAFPLTSMFLAALSLMAPVLLVAEHKSALRSLMHSITLRYARQVPLGGWSAFLSMVTIGGLFFSIEFALEWLAGAVLDWFGAVMPPFISHQVPGMPFTVGFALVDAIQAFLTTAIVCLLPGVTAGLYMQVHFRQSRREISTLA